MSVISYAQAKTLVLDRLDGVLKTMPVSERDRPRYVIGFKTFSINQLIVQVEMDTETGKSYVYSEARNLGYAVA